MKAIENKVMRTAELLKALGHPVRVEILRIISGSKAHKLTVKQVHESLHISQPEASKHLIVMKNQSILLCERKEGHSFYRINAEQAFLKNILNFLKKNEKAEE